MARGDHIKVRRCGGLYWHHGVDMGDGTVIHYSGEPAHRKNASICRVSMDEFRRGKRARIVSYDNPLRDQDAAAEEALAHLGRRDYDLFRRNCEHFACYCKTGRWKSGQISRLAKTAASLAQGGRGDWRNDYTPNVTEAEEAFTKIINTNAKGSPYPNDLQ